MNTRLYMLLLFYECCRCFHFISFAFEIKDSLFLREEMISMLEGFCKYDLDCVSGVYEDVI